MNNIHQNPYAHSAANFLPDDIDYRTQQTKLGTWKTFMHEDGATFHEFRSHASFMDLPLYNYTQGKCPETGKSKTARGIIAVGRFAEGVFAIGQVAYGIVAIGQLAIGLLAVGQLAIGVLSIGQGAIALWFALGQFAVGYYAVGMFAAGYFANGLFAAGAVPVGKKVFRIPVLVW